MAKEIYEYNGKRYKKVPTKLGCLGCDLILNDEGCSEAPCMGKGRDFKFKEIK